MAWLGYITDGLLVVWIIGMPIDWYIERRRMKDDQQ